MALIDDWTREQLRTRFEQRLSGPVHLVLYTRPGSGRLILPAGMGCATCDDARGLVEVLADADPEHVTVDIVDLSRDGEQAAARGITEVPTILVGKPEEQSRIRFQGLPAGTGFAALVDAIERVSADDPGLAPASLEQLMSVTSPFEIMVFATPT